VTTRLLALLSEVPTRGRRIHDANVVATMLVYGVRRVLTHNTDDFVRFAAFIEVLPLLPSPAPEPPPST
jgi:predicted nucleic acid-binding protein